MASKASNGFGMIHELAKMESDLRRELAVAKNDVHIALEIVRDGGDMPLDTLQTLLGRALESLSRVAGD